MTAPIIQQTLNHINFQLKEEVDLSFLSDLGEAFCVFDQNNSGNISFGLKNKAGKKFFVKIAGLQTCNMSIEKTTAVQILKESVSKYRDLADERLIQIIDYFEYNQLFVVLFEWFEGECLFDHWNFDYYEKNRLLSLQDNNSAS